MKLRIVFNLSADPGLRAGAWKRLQEELGQCGFHSQIEVESLVNMRGFSTQAQGNVITVENLATITITR